MKVINLSHKDPDIFQTDVTTSRCDFIMNHFEAFMQMYKSQGSTFWLRFIVSFKTHMEEKVFTSKKWLTLLIQYQLKFIKVLNYVYICIHKKFIESSNTAVKKFINNLMTLALNSPSFLNYSCDCWIRYFKASKQLQDILQNVLDVLDPYTYDGYTILIYTVYTDFLCALSAIFEQWYEKTDLSEEDFNKIDSKLIYWLPPLNDGSIKASCFEKYIADYWKEDLQRMLLTDDVHNIYGSHKTSGCCEKYGKEKSLFNVLQFTSKHTMELVKVMNSGKKMDEQARDCNVHRITEICMKDISILRPHVKHCSVHENCYVRVCHAEDCCEPFLCSGSSPCVLTCEIDSKSLKKEYKKVKFWKNVSVEKIPIDGNKCDASTVAESYDKFMETYLHIKENIDIDIPLSVLKHTYQCMAEFHNLDFNPRRTECLNRLRKKLTQKHPTNSYQFNFSQPFYRESLLVNAERNIVKLQEQVCTQRNHSSFECEGKCFLHNANSVAIDSSYPFGRVINFSKTYKNISVPPLICEHSCEINLKKTDAQKSESKKSSKTHSAENKKDENPESINTENDISVMVSSSDRMSENEVSNVEEATVPFDSNNEGPETNADDEIDEILKLIGINEEEEVSQKAACCMNYEETSLNNSVNDSSSKDMETVENFFKLIGVKDNCTPEITSSGPPAYRTFDSKNNLKVCAYCKKKETQRKMFKKCSKCKEENFPVQHYYCSQDCLMEDWIESHEKEHLKYKKS